MFTNTLYLLNKNAQLSYVYKTKQKFTYKLYLQSKIQNRKFTKQKTKVYIQVMFTKQNTKQKVYKNKTKVYIQVVFIKQVMFTKQNTKQRIQSNLKPRIEYSMCVQKTISLTRELEGTAVPK